MSDELKQIEAHDQILDVKYQDITYYMKNKSKVVESKDHTHIDFLKAMSEMESLDWTFSENYIGFENHGNQNNVQFIRLSKDKWYAEVPIKNNKNWAGYAWIARTNGKTISDMMRLFFEEVSWMEMLSWKMMRFPKWLK